MRPVPGIHTTEFWLTAVANIAGAIIALLAAYGLVREEHGRLWLTLIEAIAVAVVPLALAWINTSYIKGRSAVKSQEGASNQRSASSRQQSEKKAEQS